MSTICMSDVQPTVALYVAAVQSALGYLFRNGIRIDVLQGDQVTLDDSQVFVHVY